MKFRAYLNVPFAEKDAAKALGAKWDQRVRKWYVTDGCDPEAFKSWFSVWEEDDGLSINAPLFVAESTSACWSCKETTPVIALAVEMIDGDGGTYISTLSNIEELPRDLSRLFAARYPFFRRSFSKTARMIYFMNHCRCGAPLGDFYLHDEPGGSFCPTSPDEGRKILLRRLASAGRVVLKAGGYSVSTDDFIGRYATRSTL